MNSLRITGPKQIKAEHLVAMAVHIEWLATVLCPSNTFTLFLKYFIRAIANAKNKSQRDALCLSSWSCGMPVPAFHSCCFGKDGCLSTRQTCFWSPPPPNPPSSCSLISIEIKKRQRKKARLDLSTLEDRGAQTKETIWSVRNQIPFWDVFNIPPSPHQHH